MLLIFGPEIRIFVYNQTIDMRAGFLKLQALIVEQMKGDLFAGHFLWECSEFCVTGSNRILSVYLSITHKLTIRNLLEWFKVNYWS